MINEIDFEIGGFPGFFDDFIFEITKEGIEVTHSSIDKNEKYNLSDFTGEIVTKDEFLKELYELHIGEWRKNYDTKRFGLIVIDGDEWKLTIKYSDKHRTIEKYGSNSFPYNFDDLLTLLDIEH